MGYRKIEGHLKRVPENYAFWLNFMDRIQYARLHGLIARNIVRFAKEAEQLGLDAEVLQKQAMAELIADLLSYMFSESDSPEREMHEFLEHTGGYAMDLLKIVKMRSDSSKLN